MSLLRCTIIFFLAIVVFVDFDLKGDTKPEIKRTNQKVVTKLYQLMKDIDELFAAHDIQYWIDFGTLLGAVRSLGFILWDNDLDIGTDVKNKTKIFNLKKEIEKLGYRLKNKKGLACTIRGYHREVRLDLDIIFCVQKQDKIYPLYPVPERRDGEFLYFLTDELYPLKKYQFGPLVLSGPNNPIIYLNNAYGNDWPTTRRIVANNYRKPYPLSEEDKMPALPNKLLLDRVAKKFDLALRGAVNGSSG